jgi:hypothetical protein
MVAGGDGGGECVDGGGDGVADFGGFCGADADLGGCL